MPVIIDYILKLSICLAVVYLFYQLLLRRLTFYTWNRWYLLGYSLLSFIIPLIDIMPELQKKELDQNALVQLIPVFGFVPADASSFLESLTTWDWVLLIAVLGSLILLVRFLVMFGSLLRVKRSAQLISDDRTRIYQLDEDMRPFSFGNAIFINTALHSGEELEEIIRHEFVHVKQKHTLDIIWSELLCILLWFNPFVWLLRKNIKQNLEFLADKQVLQNGMDKKEYQYLLLKVMGNKQFAFTNHFNFSSLKNRIAMMNTIKSARVHLAKFLFLLPVVAVLLLSFRKEVLHERKIKEAERVSDSPAEPVDERNGAIQKVLQLALMPRDTTPSKTGKQKYYVIVTNTGFSNKIQDPAEIVTRMSRSEWDANKEKYEHEYGHAPAAKLHLRQGDETGLGFDSVYVLKRSPRTVVSISPPLYIVDGRVLNSKEGLNGIDANTIKSVSVLKNQSAEKLYGEKGKNGVVIITTKKEAIIKMDSAKGPVLELRPESTDEPNKKLILKEVHSETAPVASGQDFSGTKPGVVLRTVVKPAPLYVVNGAIANASTVKEIDPKNIESVTVLKDASATTIYGDAARNGAVLIATKTKSMLAVKKDPLQEVIVGGYGVRKGAATPPVEKKQPEPIKVKGYKKETLPDEKNEKPVTYNFEPAKTYKINLTYTATFKPGKEAVAKNDKPADVKVFRSTNGQIEYRGKDFTKVADTIVFKKN